MKIENVSVLPNGGALKLDLLIAMLLIVLSPVAYFWFDKRLFDFAAELHVDWTAFMAVKGLVQLGKVWVVLWLVCLWVWRSGLRRSVLAVLLGLLFLAPIVPVLKMTVQRARPKTVLSETASAPHQTVYDRFANARRQSFPSGDTATVFAAAVVLGLFTSRISSAGWFLVATLVGALRVLTLNHYLSDVLAGAGIGMLSGVCAYWVVIKRVPQERLFTVIDVTRKVGLVSLLALLLLNYVCERFCAIMIFMSIYWPVVLLCLLYVELLQWRQKRYWSTRGGRSLRVLSIKYAQSASTVSQLNDPYE